MPIPLKRLPVVADDRPSCQTCTAACCMGLWVPVTRRDIRRLARGLDLTPKEVLERYVVWTNELPVVRKHEDHKQPVFVMRDGPLGTRDFPVCVFLREDGRCGVYEHRPQTCREFSMRSSPCERYYTRRSEARPRGKGRQDRARRWAKLEAGRVEALPRPRTIPPTT